MPKVRPIDIVLTPGQTHDSQPAPSLLEGMRQGAILLADKACDSDAIREQLDKIGAWANIPAKKNRTKTFPFSKRLYRRRNLVERFFNKLKQFRGIASSEVLQPDTTRALTTSLPPSNSHRCA